MRCSCKIDGNGIGTLCRAHQKAVEAEREACEWIIRANVEGSNGGRKSLFPRGADDLAGLAYADAIANRSK